MISFLGYFLVVLSLAVSSGAPWKDSSSSEMAYYVSSVVLNFIHSLVTRSSLYEAALHIVLRLSVSLSEFSCPNLILELSETKIKKITTPKI